VGSARRHGALVALTIAALTAALACPSAVLAAGSPYDHLWRAQGEVGGDRGGKSQQAVLADSMQLESVAGGYRGLVTYSDRVVVQDGTGAILVQVSRITLNLVGAPASGGTAVAGNFDGSAQLDTYKVASFADGVAGRLPAKPSGSVTYEVLGHWGAQLAGSSAAGELAYGSATIRSSSGSAVQRDATWFMRSDAGSQRFNVEVKGASSAPTGGGGDGTGPAAGDGSTSATTKTGLLEYLRRGLLGDGGRPVVPVPTESATAARRLRTAMPVGATAMPANTVTIDLDIAGHTLDAKNRACGTSATTPAGARARTVWRSAIRAASDIQYKQTQDLDGMLATSEVSGARELQAAIRAAMVSSAGSPLVTQARIREWDHVVRAVQTPQASAVLAAGAEAAGGVRDSRTKPGPLSDALLAAADAFDAPRSALAVATFRRVTSKDLSGPSGGLVVGDALGAAVRGQHGRALVIWTDASGALRAEPVTWMAYARADSTLFWLADPEGAFALTDGTLDGWGFSARRAYLVDASRVGRLLAIMPAPPAKQ